MSTTMTRPVAQCMPAVDHESASSDAHGAPTVAFDVQQLIAMPTRVAMPTIVDTEPLTRDVATTHWARGDADEPVPATVIAPLATVVLPAVPSIPVGDDRVRQGWVAPALLVVATMGVVAWVAWVAWRAWASTVPVPVSMAESASEAPKVEVASVDELPAVPTQPEQPLLLERGAADALLAGDRRQALRRYREWAEQTNNPTARRVVEILEQQP